MHLRIASLTLLCLLAATTASGQVLYDNGPVNGTVDAWTINFGFVVSDTFTLANNSTVGGFDMAVWEFKGDTVLTVGWSVTSQENFGTLYGSGNATVSDKFISVNQFGYDIDELTATGLNLPLNAGTYWINMQNAVVTNGDPVYWDENNGVGCKGDNGMGGNCPSMPSENDSGTILSESFDITGTSGGTTPEPSSILLFGSGIVAVGSMLVRRLR